MFRLRDTGGIDIYYRSDIAADGARSLVFGGTAGNSRLGLTDVDLFVEIATEMRKCIVANDDDINIVGGRYRIKVNGAETSILN